MIGRKIRLMKSRTKRLIDTYQIIKKLGAGSFGEVYLAKNKQGEVRAAKIETKKDEKHPKLYNEYRIYKNLLEDGDVPGIPGIDTVIETDEYNMMFMQLMGPSLEDMFKRTGRFNTGTVIQIALQTVSILEYIHDNYYIHRDIKPSNFVLGREVDGARDQVHIIDFGLSKKYRNRRKHISFKNNRSMIGTSRYASTNMHRGYEPSRRDDLESLGHMLIYLIKGGLPWQGLNKKKLSDSDNAPTIGDVKLSTSSEELCKGLPSCFKEFIDYCRGLSFTQDPDYFRIKRMFTNWAASNQVTVKLQWV